ncbi:hypothetical protein BSG1_08271 [Bacillus sp. SG-1]|nr:hypothetical protein BSG1_08271 [Bacillus sp. SG-1]
MSLSSYSTKGVFAEQAAALCSSKGADSEKNKRKIYKLIYF